MCFAIPPEQSPSAYMAFGRSPRIRCRNSRPRQWQQGSDGNPSNGPYGDQRGSQKVTPPGSWVCGSDVLLPSVAFPCIFPLSSTSIHPPLFSLSGHPSPAAADLSTFVACWFATLFLSLLTLGATCLYVCSRDALVVSLTCDFLYSFPPELHVCCCGTVRSGSGLRSDAYIYRVNPSIGPWYFCGRVGRTPTRERVDRGSSPAPQHLPHRWVCS
jgi:hypothetical protein